MLRIKCLPNSLVIGLLSDGWTLVPAQLHHSVRTNTLVAPFSEFICVIGGIGGTSPSGVCLIK